MNNRSFKMHSGKMGAAIAVRVTPRASQNSIQEILNDGTVRIHLTAASDDPKVNQKLVDYLSQVLEIPSSHLEVVAGESGHDKLVAVLNMDARQVHERILKKLS